MLLCESIEVAAPIARCFDLCRSVELHVDGSREIAGRAVGGKTTGLAQLGDRTTWSARFFGVRSRMTTEVTAFDAPRAFSDELVAGLLRRFRHDYGFTETPAGCRIEDRLRVESPAGARVDRWLLESKLRRVMRERLASIKAAAETDAWKRYLRGRLKTP